MHDRGTTSWRRLSDKAPEHADSAPAPSAPTPPPNPKEAQLQAWEGEGGTTARATGPVRILIVDNDMGSADSLELMLHASGYSETRVAYSGHAALAIATDFQPDMVLLDLSLLDMTGYELAQSLREQAQSRELRMIALTSSPEHTAREQARVAGFERYLVKPVAPRDLSDLVEAPTQ
jgi:CheY-like chemotaxis protein